MKINFWAATRPGGMVCNGIVRTMQKGSSEADAVAEVYLGDGLYNTVRVGGKIDCDLDIPGDLKELSGAER